MNAKWAGLIAGIVTSVSVSVAGFAADETQVMYIPGPVLNAKEGKFQKLTVSDLVLLAPGNLDVGGSLSVGPDVDPDAAHPGSVKIERQLQMALPASSPGALRFEIGLATVDDSLPVTWTLVAGQQLQSVDPGAVNHGIGLLDYSTGGALQGAFLGRVLASGNREIVLKSFLDPSDPTVGWPLVLRTPNNVMWLNGSNGLNGGGLNIGFSPFIVGPPHVNPDTLLYVLREPSPIDLRVAGLAQFVNFNNANGETRGIGIGPGGIIAVAYDNTSGPPPVQLDQDIYLIPSVANDLLPMAGHVGIGSFPAGSFAGSELEVRGQGTTAAPSSLNVTNSTPTSLLFVRDDGNVGVGTAVPSAKLHVVQNGAADALRVDDGDATPFVIDQNGNVGIGVAAPAASLDLGAGNIRLGGRTSARVVPIVSGEFTRTGGGIGLDMGAHDLCFLVATIKTAAAGLPSCQITLVGVTWRLGAAANMTCRARCLDWN